MSERLKRTATGADAIAAVAAGGAAIGNAASSPSAATTTTASPGASSGPPGFPAHGTAAHEDAEKGVTGSDAIKAQAAAVKAAGGGTAGGVTTDFTGNGYEVTVTKTDGSTVEIHFDSSFEVMQAPGPGGFGH